MRKQKSMPEEAIYAGVRLAYIRQITVAEARAMGVDEVELSCTAGTKLYAVHASDGTPMAVVDDYAVAHAAALKNEFQPVRVH